MATTFKFELITPERAIVLGDAAATKDGKDQHGTHGGTPVEQVVLPGAEGDFAVLAGHAPMISTLRPGTIEVTMPGGKILKFFVKSGFAEVNGSHATVLADQVMDLATVKPDAIAAEIATAETALAAAKSDDATFMARETIDRLKAIATPAGR